MFKISIVLLVVITVGIVPSAFAENSDCWFIFCWLEKLFEPKQIEKIEPQNTITKNIENKVHELIFDCAKTYDEMRDIYYTEWDPIAPINSGINYPVREKMAEKEDLLSENSCMDKKGDWAYKSKYENEIWGIEEVKEMTFSQCVDDYRSKYCLFYEEGEDRKIECEREVYQNALNICEEYR